jgi:L-lactate dehydrogenase (cytochrome)
MIAASIEDYRELARRRLPPFLFEYIDGGANAEQTLRNNISDLANIALRQRVLRDVSKVDLTANLFGAKQDLPVMLGPIGLGGINARRGEVQAARAAAKANVPFCLSTVSLCPLEEVRQGSGKPLWFQLYMIRDRPFMRDLLVEVKRNQCPVLVFTVDMPMPGSRYRDYRSGLAGAPGLKGALRRTGQAMLKPGWAWDVGINGRPHGLGNLRPVLGEKSGLDDYFAWMANNFDPSVTWKDLDWIRENWDGPLIIKGILDPDDARAAADLGADGIVVSNHGGRQLDGVLSSTRALPAIADAVGERLTVLADGGVRSGLDVVRMMALGAKGVLLGRAWVFALAGRGEKGVSHVLEIIKKEMSIALALTGATNLSELSRDSIERLS